MDEILALQRELAVAQQTSTTQRLSDRNCVELVQKLQTLKLISLIFTRCGKEYLTPARLHEEILDELTANRGRLHLTDLAETLNVSPTHIETAVPKILEDETISLIRGELVSTHYLQTLLEEVNDNLLTSPTGTDTVGEIATRYTLPVDIVRDTLSQYGDISSAHYDSTAGTLVSKAAMLRYEAQARGVLLATTTATNVHDMLHSTSAPSLNIHQTLSKMISDGKLSGVVQGQGKRQTFTPAVYTKAVTQALQQDFTTHSFIPLKTLKRLHITDSGLFADANLRNSTMLSQCIVADVLFDTLTTSVIEAMDSGSWLDLQGALPPGFPTEDIAAIASNIEKSLSKPDENQAKTPSTKQKRKAKSKQKQVNTQEETKVIYANRFFASRKLINQIQQVIVTNAETEAQKHAAKMAERLEVAKTTVESTRSKPETRPELEETPKKGKAKGKARRRAGGKEKSSTSEIFSSTPMNDVQSLNDDNAIETPTLEQVVDLVFNNDSCSQALESDYLSSSNDSDTLLTTIVEDLYGEVGLHALYRSKATEALETLRKQQARMQQALEKALLTGLADAEMYSKGAATLAEEELTQSSRKWVMDTVVTNAVCHITHTVAQNNGVHIHGLAQAETLSSKKSKVDILRTACAHLPKTLEAQVRQFVNLVSRSRTPVDGSEDESEIEEFLQMYDASVLVLDLPARRPVDKKTERAWCLMQRADILAHLDPNNVETSSAVMPSLSLTHVLKYATILTHAKCNNGAIFEFDTCKAVEFAKAIEEVAHPNELVIELQTLRKSIETQTQETKEENDSDSYTNGKTTTTMLENLDTLRQLIK